MKGNQQKVLELLEQVNEQSKHNPTVYDCDGCKHNNGLVKDDHCSGCRLPDGVNWVEHLRPTKYEPVITTFTTQTT